MRPPFFVMESTSLSQLFKDMKKTKNTMAVVVDEHGGTSGIITLMDIIQEIVGDIELDLSLIHISLSEKGHAAPSLPDCKRARNAPACCQLFAGSSLQQNIPQATFSLFFYMTEQSSLCSVIFLCYGIHISRFLSSRSRSAHLFGCMRTCDSACCCSRVKFACAIKIYFCIAYLSK